MPDPVKLNVVHNTGKDGKVVAVGLEAPDGHVTPVTPEQAYDVGVHEAVRNAFDKRNGGSAKPQD